MACNRQQADTKFIHTSANFPHRLRRIRMEQNFMFVGNPGNVSDRLNSANLVVGMHDGNQCRARLDRASDLVRIDPPEPIDGEIGHFCA